MRHGDRRSSGSPCAIAPQPAPRRGRSRTARRPVRDRERRPPAPRITDAPDRTLAVFSTALYEPLYPLDERRVRVQGGEPRREADGTVDGDNLTWKADITTPMAMTLEFSATVNGDEISGDVKLGAFGNASFSGTRA